MPLSLHSGHFHHLKPLLLFLFIFSLSYLILLPQTDNFCHQIDRIDFDTQNVFLWDHLAETGVEPYKDFFYPYGLLVFNKSQSLSWFFVYTLISPLLFTIIYCFLINRLFSNLMVKLICFFGLITFVINNIGLISYARYGLIISGALLSVWLIQTYSRHSILMPILVGLLSGLVSFASGSDGLYLLLVQIMLIILYFSSWWYPLFLKAVIPVIRSLLFLGLGVLIGLIPLMLYLRQNQLTGAYFNFYQEMVFLGDLAKIPYATNTFHEIFIILTLTVSVLSLLYLFYHPKFRLRYSTHLLAACVMCLGLMQQKNIIRSFGATMAYYAVIVVIVLFALAARNLFRRHPYYHLKTTLFACLLFYCLIVSLKLPFSPAFLKRSLEAYSPQSWRQTLNLEGKLCRGAGIDWSKLHLPDVYSEVIQYIQSQPGGHSFVTYPYDPIYYLLGNEPPLPYPNAYESAFLKAQETNLRFLDRKNIQYLIYSPPSTPIDWAPDYVRTLHFTRYLFTHFTPIKTLGPFTIFKKSSVQEGAFTPNNSVRYPRIYDYFTKVWWNNLPLSEGQKHSDQILVNSQNLGLYTDLVSLNNSLKANPQNTNNLYLVFNYLLPISPQGQMTLTNTLGQSTIITYNIKANTQHLIIPANLPLFWAGGQIASIGMNPPPSNLWLAVNHNKIDTWQ